jgi:cytochrome P450
MLNLDAPDHTRLRKLVSKAFTPKVIERLRPRIQQLVDEALDRVAPTNEMELIRDLAFPLPFAVISEMLGMPETDGAQLREWSGTLVRSLEPLVDPDLIRAIAEAADRMRDFTAEAISWKRRQPGDDLLSALIAAEEGGDVLSDDELVDQVMLLYIAGHETTVNLIGNGILAFIRNPAEWEKLRANPELARRATEECLRFDPPVKSTQRIATRDATMGDRTIRRGERLRWIIAAANRDPDVFPDPDRFLIDRHPNPHVSLGVGIHFCLGAALARVEGQELFRGLSERVSSFRLETVAPEYQPSIQFRSLRALSVTMTMDEAYDTGRADSSSTPL